MSSATTPTSSFGVLTGPGDDELLATAATIASAAVDDPSIGVVVIVVRPEARDHRVISGGGTGILRAAVSVVTAAGNDRAWREAPDGDTCEQPVRALPEVIAAAAEADGVRAVYTGCVRVDDVPESVVIWFETWSGVASPEQRRVVLADLAAAGARERERRAALSAASPAAATTGAQPTPPREFDPNDPELDPVTGLLRVERWSELIEDFERDEAMLVLIELDDLATVATEWDDDVSDAVLREIANRLVSNCRAEDVIARLGHDRMAVLFGAIERSEVIEIAKRLLAAVTDPLPAHLGPDHLTAIVALAHQVGLVDLEHLLQVGLVDLEEMLESAADALASGKRSGAGRIVLAA